MRFTVTSRFVAILALFIPSALFAQFLSPTNEELRMISDPKFPGADAIFLNVDEVTNDPQHFSTFYVRIKVITAKATALRRVKIPLQLGDFGASSRKPQMVGQNWVEGQTSRDARSGLVRIDDIRARTIHPDGTIYPISPKSEDLEQLKASGGLPERRAFVMPDVEVGSILEYRYTVRYDEKHDSSPYWIVQRTYPIRRAHFSFTPFNDFLTNDQEMTSKYLLDAKGKVVNTIIWSPVLPAGAAVKTDPDGSFSLDVTNIPALPSEEWMPPSQMYAYHVRFYYKSAFTGSEFWAEEQKQWSKEVNRFAGPTSFVNHAVTELVPSGSSDIDTARKLYSTVQSLENTSLRSASAAASGELPASRAEEVLTRKHGSSHEIALLYLSLLRAAGITAYDMEIVDRDKGVFSSGYLSSDQFDSDVIIATLNGKEVYLDPGEKMCPFRSMHWKHAGASGIRQTATGAAIATTPLLPYAVNAITRTGDINLDANGTLNGLFRFILAGQDALNWRQQVVASGESATRDAFDKWLESISPDGVKAHLDHFLGADNPDLNLIAVIKVEGSVVPNASGQVLLAPFLFESQVRKPFISESQRLQPIDMHYGQQVSDEIVYHLPEGFAMQSPPSPEGFTLEHLAVFASAVKPDQGQVTVTRSLVRAFTLANSSEFGSLQSFYKKIAQADGRTIVLARSPSASGL